MSAEVGEQGSRDDTFGPVFFRSINDRISEQLDEIAGVAGRVSDLRDFICECRSLGCTSTVRATVAEFDEIRAGDHLFLIDPVHGAEAPDRLLRTTPRFAIVELRRPAA